ncbi:MAG: HAMP domain-containing histidine kinase [Clostridiales bacterium]|nr:HAMP domain-containing histidine kinase [Clostridiales bacterium]
MLKKLKIRTKMMLWYTLLTTLLLAVFLPVVVRSIETALLDREKLRVQALMTLVETEVEFEDGQVVISEDLMLPLDITVVVFDAEGELLLANGETRFCERPWAGELTEEQYDGSRWLRWDRELYNDGAVRARIRICSSIDSVAESIRRSVTPLLLSIPVCLLVTIIGGLWIARRALRPVHRIAVLAGEIGRGDISKRITGIESADEVGELADTFNEMLDSIEQTLIKEKRFSSDASHELRTPVAVIQAGAESILAAGAEEQIGAAASAILHESRRMNGIIAQLLMLTRGTEGKYRLQRETLSLPVIVDAVLEAHGQEAEARGIRLWADVQAGAILWADQSLITQMLLNLVENAIKYGKPGGQVWVRADSTDAGVRIVVSDDGVGIAPADLPHIFERFYRADTSRDRSGSGLGLSIVQWIVDAHKGSLEVESEPGVGTSVAVRLPKLNS